MRIIHLIADAHGRVHLAASRAPDLRRRELSALTGQGLLLAVALAPAGATTPEAIAAIDRRLSSRRVAGGVYVATPGEALRAFHRGLTACRLHDLGMRIVRRVRRPGRQLRRLCHVASWRSGHQR